MPILVTSGDATCNWTASWTTPVGIFHRREHPRMCKTSLLMKGRTLIKILQGSFLTAQSWGLCREGFMGEGNKGAWTVMAHLDLPSHRAAFTNKCKAVAQHIHSNLGEIHRHTAQQFGFSSVQQNVTTLNMTLDQCTSPKSQAAPTQPFLSSPKHPSLSTGLIPGQQENGTICSWISHLNQREAENSAPAGTLKVGFLASISKYVS